MSLNVEQRIRDRAYAIWQEQGCPEGCDYEHWLMAEQEVADASGTPVVPEAAPEKASAKASKAPATERKPRARKAAVTA